MDYHKDYVLTMFLGLKHGSYIAVYAGSESSQTGPKMTSFLF